MSKLPQAVTLALAVLSAVVFSSTAFALDFPGQVGDRPEVRDRQQVQAIINRPNNATPEGRFRACQSRENAVKRRSAHLTQLATNMINVFDRHAQRVENYYTSKLVPQGKTVPNYSSLVADISTKKTVVTTALTTAQKDAASFSCTSGDPKAQLTSFRQDMQAVKVALKDYRTSIRNLIVAVHSVTGTTNSSNQASSSAQPGK